MSFLASVDIRLKCVSCLFDPFTGRSSLGNLRCSYVLFFSFVNVICFSCVKRFMPVWSFVWMLIIRQFALFVRVTFLLCQHHSLFMRYFIRFSYVGLCGTRVTGPLYPTVLMWIVCSYLHYDVYEDTLRQIQYEVAEVHYLLVRASWIFSEEPSSRKHFQRTLSSRSRY